MAKTRGSPFLLTLQRIANIALLIVSLCFIGAGVFMMITIKQISVFPLIFVVIGALEILLAFLSICNSTSKAVMKFYFYTLLVLVGIQVVSVGVCIIFQDRIIEWAGENYSTDQQAAQQFEDLIKDNITIAMYIAGVSSIVQILCLLINVCYKRSMKRVYTAHEKRLMGDSYYGLPGEDFNEKKERAALEKRKEKFKADYKAKNMDYRQVYE